jgi:ABC-type transport system substrate-binding protein
MIHVSRSRSGAAWKTRVILGLTAVLLLQTVGIAVAQDTATPMASPVASPVAAAADLPLAEIPQAPGSEQPDAIPDATVAFNLGNEISTGDPQVMAFLNEIEIASKVYVPLLALNDENLVADAGADTATVSADGTVYTFNIREGMTYTDGEPVTAGNYSLRDQACVQPGGCGQLLQHPLRDHRV